jgi:hypothetical protein
MAPGVVHSSLTEVVAEPVLESAVRGLVRRATALPATVTLDAAHRVIAARALTLQQGAGQRTRRWLTMRPRRGGTIH